MVQGFSCLDWHSDAYLVPSQNTHYPSPDLDFAIQCEDLIRDLRFDTAHR